MAYTVFNATQGRVGIGSEILSPLAASQPIPRLTPEILKLADLALVSYTGFEDIEEVPPEPTVRYTLDADGYPFPLDTLPLVTHRDEPDSERITSLSVTDGNDTWVKTVTYTSPTSCVYSAWVRQSKPA